MSVRVWAYADGSTILSINGVWDSEIERGLETVPFDGLDVGSDCGSFEGLAPFAEKIRWLHSPEVKSAAGLEKLQYVERITYVGNIHKPPFDYRRLPRLTSLSCRPAATLAGDARPLGARSPQRRPAHSLP